MIRNMSAENIPAGTAFERRVCKLCGLEGWLSTVQWRAGPGVCLDQEAMTTINITNGCTKCFYYNILH